jgi:hypothetical protein
MNSRITDNREGIDRKTSRSICDAVGERLQQNLKPESSDLSPHLQRLLDELRKREREERPGSERPGSERPGPQRRRSLAIF